MIPVQIRFTRKIIEHVDKLIDNGVYSNRSEAIRDATRRLVMEFSSKEGLDLGLRGQGKAVQDMKRGLNVR